MIKFVGILVAEPIGFKCPIPEGFFYIDHPHITLLSWELSKENKQKLRDTDLSILDEFPSITWNKPYLADNGKKISIVRDAIEQQAIKAWVWKAIADLKLDCYVDNSRIYHVSVANKTGSQYDSVPDPWNHRK